MTPAREAVAGLWAAAGLPATALPELRLTGAGAVLPSSFRVADAAQASIAAATAAVALLHRRRGGGAQPVRVDRRHAAVEFLSERHLRLDGRPLPDAWDALAGAYRCRDGSAVRLHTNFPHHRAGVLTLLGCAPTRDAVAAALSRWDAFAFEAAAAEAGLCVAALRTLDEWDAHPQGIAANALPPLRIERIADAPPIPLPPVADRPLSGLRVLELTRVIAGPVAGRTLAAHGADVLHVSGAALPTFDTLLPDTQRGKRSCHIDLRTPEGRDRLRALTRGADILLQGYRPGALAALGVSPAALAALRPGLVVASLSAYGKVGPWGGRRGFDSLVQTASGLNHAEAEAAGERPPRVLPCQALDHASGLLLAFGCVAALLRRAESGGSWHVRVSLAGTGAWLRRLGRLAHGFAIAAPAFDTLRDLLEDSDSGFGRLTAVRHAGELPLTPPRWALPAVPLGSHPAAW